MNILKENTAAINSGLFKRELDILFKKAYQAFNWSELELKIKQGVLVEYRFFELESISVKSSSDKTAISAIKVSQKQNIAVVSSFLYYFKTIRSIPADVISQNAIELLQQEVSKIACRVCEYELDNISDLIFHLHIDLLIGLYLLKQAVLTYPGMQICKKESLRGCGDENAKDKTPILNYPACLSDNVALEGVFKLWQYIEAETNTKQIQSILIKNASNQKQQRSTIYTFNKNSIIFDLEAAPAPVPQPHRDALGLSVDNIKLLKTTKNPLLKLIEIPADFDNQKLNLFLIDFNKICRKIGRHIRSNFVEVDCKDFKFTLKIRKIKRTHKNGMYIPGINTILLDPRYLTEAAYMHELGHWFHCQLHPEINTIVKAEEFAENFIKYLGK